MDTISEGGKSIEDIIREFSVEAETLYTESLWNKKTQEEIEIDIMTLFAQYLREHDNAHQNVHFMKACLDILNKFGRKRIEAHHTLPQPRPRILGIGTKTLERLRIILSRMR